MVSINAHLFSFIERAEDYKLTSILRPLNPSPKPRAPKRSADQPAAEASTASANALVADV